MITPKLIKIDGFTVRGLAVRTINTDEFNLSTAKLPVLWEQFASNNELRQDQNAYVYGVYSDYESNADGAYTVTAGIKSDLLSAASTLHSISILSGDYLVFEQKGEMPHAVIEAWKSVWQYFESNKEIRRRFQTDFELYTSANEIMLYIGI
jgi:predicted transcriptional regulator YdeE